MARHFTGLKKIKRNIHLHLFVFIIEFTSKFSVNFLFKFVHFLYSQTNKKRLNEYKIKLKRQKSAHINQIEWLLAKCLFVLLIFEEKKR